MTPAEKKAYLKRYPNSVYNKNRNKNKKGGTDNKNKGDTANKNKIEKLEKEYKKLENLKRIADRKGGDSEKAAQFGRKMRNLSRQIKKLEDADLAGKKEGDDSKRARSKRTQFIRRKKKMMAESSASRTEDFVSESGAGADRFADYLADLPIDFDTIEAWLQEVAIKSSAEQMQSLVVSSKSPNPVFITEILITEHFSTHVEMDAEESGMSVEEYMVGKLKWPEKAAKKAADTWF